MGLTIHRECDFCGTGYVARSPRSKFCTPKCRRRAHDRRAAGEAPEPVVVDDETPGPVLAAALAELEGAGVASTTLGRAALALARRLDAGEDVGSSMAAASRELRTLLELLTGDAQGERDPIDELKARREAAQRGA